MKNNKVIDIEKDADIFLRIGLKYLYRKSYSKALKYIDKAVLIDPFNADYKFNLAGAYAEAGMVSNSNDTLKDILVYINPTLSETYFGIGCNYFDLEDYEKAKEYFEKYLYFEPVGYYSGDVEDALFYLGSLGLEKWKKRTKSVSRKILKSCDKLLDSKSFDKVFLKLEQALEIDPSDIILRNALSFAQFLSGNIEKAIYVAKSVLLLEPEDITSHCNLVLCYHQKSAEKEYKQCFNSLSKLEIIENEELLKVLNTCLFVKEFTGIGKLFRKFSGSKKEFVNVLENTMDTMSVSNDDREIIMSNLKAKRAK